MSMPAAANERGKTRLVLLAVPSICGLYVAGLCLPYYGDMPYAGGTIALVALTTFPFPGGAELAHAATIGAHLSLGLGLLLLLFGRGFAAGIVGWVAFGFAGTIGYSTIDQAFNFRALSYGYACLLGCTLLLAVAGFYLHFLFSQKLNDTRLSKM